MGTSVDNRIVKMQFDNKQFESGCKTTLNTLDKLKQSLNFQGATDSLKSLASSINNFSFGAMQKGIDVMTNKFSVLGTMTDQFIRRLTDQLMSTGKMIANTFTIDPIKTGFEEYTTQINAVQTILANTQSKGTTLDDVNNALDELNHYADKTIYNFTEMTRNIGTFTAAGVDLDTSVTAIKGIANLAAVSGANATQASTAMYQLSQALASGTVRLQDWLSIEHAGLGGQMFQDVLKETAREFGVDIDKMIEDEGALRDTLSSGWLTTDILTASLAKFTDETTELGKTATDAATVVKTFSQLWDTMKEAVQSGWTETWEIVIGDFEEAKSTLTEVNNFVDNVIQSYNEFRNSQLRVWKDLGGREKQIKSFWNIVEAIKTAIVPVQRALSNFIPKYTAERLVTITDGLESFTSKLKMSRTTAIQVYYALNGVFSVLNFGFTIVKSIIKALVPIVSSQGPKILQILSEAGYAITNITARIEESHIVTKTLEFIVKSVTTALSNAFIIAKSVAKQLKNLIPNKLIKMVTNLAKKFTKLSTSMNKAISAWDLYNVLRITNAFGEAIALLVDVFDSLIENVDANGESIRSLGSGILEVAGNIGQTVANVIYWIRQSGVLNVLIKAICKTISFAIGLISKLVTSVASITTGIINFIKHNKAMKIVLDALKTLLDSVMKTVDKFKDSVVNMVKAIANSEGVQNLITQLQNLWDALAPIASDAVSKAGDNLNKFVEAGSSSTAFTNFVNLVSKMAQGLADMISVLTSGGNPFEKITEGMKSGKLKELFNLKSVYMYFTNIMKKGILKTAVTELSIAIDNFASDSIVKATDFMSAFFDKMGDAATKIPWDNVLKTITQIVTGLSVISTLTSVKKSVDSLTKIFASFSAIGANINKLFTSWTDVAKTAQHTLRVKMFESIALGVAALAASLWIIAQIPADRLQASVKTLSIVFAELVAAIGILSTPIFSEKKITSIGVAFAGIGIGLLAMIGAIKLITLLNVDTIETGMKRILSVLISFAIASRLSGKVSKTAASILAMAVSVNLLLPAIYALGKMNKSTALQGMAVVIAIMESMAIASRIAQVAEGKSKGSFIGMAIAIDLIVPAIVLLGKLDRETAIQGSLIVVSVMEALAVAGKIAGRNRSAVKQAVGMVLEIAAVTAALYLLSSLDQNGIISSASALSAVVLAISGATRLMDTKDIGKQIALFSVMISELTAALLLLNNLTNPDGLNTIAISMSTILLSISGATRILSGLKLSASEGIFVGMIAIAGFIAEFAGILGLLGSIQEEYDLEGLLNRGLPILETIGLAIGDFFGNIVGGLVGGAIEGISSALPTLGENLTSFWDEAKGFFEGVSSLNDSGALEGIGVLTAAFASLFAAEFVNSILNSPLFGLITGSSNPMEDLVEAMSILIKGEDGKGGLKAFIKDCQEIDDGDIEEATKVGELITAIATSAKDIPNSGGLLGAIMGENDIGDFIAQLPSVGSGLVKYARSVEGITDEQIKISADVMKMLTKICVAAKNIPNTGGWIGEWVGNNDIGAFVAQLQATAVNLGAYANGCLPITKDMIDKSKDSMDMLMVVIRTASKIPNSGGILAKWIGDNTIGAFVKQLPDVATEMAEYCETVTDITRSSLVKSNLTMDSLASIVTVASEIPNTSGIASVFTTDLKDFANGLKKFAEQFMEYLTWVDQNVESEDDPMFAKSDALIKTCGVLADISNDLTFFGNIKMDMFASNIEDFGNGVKTYFNSVKDLTEDDLRAGNNALGMASRVCEFATGSTFSGGLKIADLGYRIADLGHGLSRYYDYVKDIDSTTVQAKTAAMKVLVEKLNDINSSFTDLTHMSDVGYELQMYGNRFKSFYDNMSDLSSGTVSSVCTSLEHVISTFKKMKDIDDEAVKNFGDALKSVAKKGIDAFTDAFDESDAKVDKAIDSFFSNVYNFVNNNQNGIYNKFYFLGGYASEGFENGLTSRMGYVQDAARSIANEALNAAQEALDSHSPSRETMKLGEYFSQGMAIGIMNLGDRVENAGYTIADKAKLALGDSLSTISAIANNRLTIDPTIRPTMDMRGVYGGYDTAYTAWTATSSMMTKAATSAVNATLNREEIYDDSSMQELVRGLRDDINTLSENMESMQIVMDTGTMVGELAKPMNKEMSRLNAYARRHN